MQSIEGTIGKVFFTKETWSSCKIQTNDDYFSASGAMSNIVEGMKIKAEGEFVEDPKYGRQFQVVNSEISYPMDAAFALNYLKSGAVAGVGEATAVAIVQKFKHDTMRIIQEDYERLAEIPRISKKKAKAIHDADAANNVYKQLCGYGLSPKKAQKLYDAYEKNAVRIIKEDPYKIIYDVDGFSFKTVDEIALKNGVKSDDPKRVAAAITFCLLQDGDNGNCYSTIDGLEAILTELIPEVENQEKVKVLAEEIKAGKIIAEDNNVIYSKRLFSAETRTAKNIANMVYNNFNPVPDAKIRKAIMDTELENGFELEKSQKDAVFLALQNRVSIITGGPGTGKSTITKAIVKGWMSQYDKHSKPEDYILLCAPTGKASRRLAEVTGVNAETCQRILMRNKNSEEKISDKLIIIDECSMIDMYLAEMIGYVASENNNRLVLIGDIDQLPPIGPGNFFRDLVNSPVIPSVTLNLCHRQKGMIAINAKRINEGQGFNALNFEDSSCKFVYAEKEGAADKVIEQYEQLMAEYGIRDVCAIVPMRKAGKSHTSADDLNKIIRDRINPLTPRNIIEDMPLRIGDRVMNTVNDYDNEVFNGDCGVITDFIDNEIIVNMDDGRNVAFSKLRATDLILAYAITVHKSQGSEYKGIVIAQNREHFYMLQRNLLYTAITRAKEKVVLVGESAAVNLAVKKIPSLERRTKLKLRLGQEIVKVRKAHS